MGGVFKSFLSHLLSAQLADTNECFLLPQRKRSYGFLSTMCQLQSSRVVLGWGWFGRGRAAAEPLASEVTGGRKQVVGMSAGKHQGGGDTVFGVQGDSIQEAHKR